MTQVGCEILFLYEAPISISSSLTTVATLKRHPKPHPTLTTTMSSSKEVAQKESGGVGQVASDSFKTVTETVSSAGASLAGAFSGSLSAGTHASSKKITTTSSSGQQLRQLSKVEADRLYEERIEDEYAKREGGA